jgi:hypothetical protein
VRDSHDAADVATKGDLREMKSELKNDIAMLEQRMDSRLLLLEQRMTIKLGTMLFATAGATVALVKLL